MLDALRIDALASHPTGFSLRISLPWIRALPLASLTDVELTVDDELVPHPYVALGDRHVDLANIESEPGWWFVQDRVVLWGNRPIDPGTHDVRISFGLTIPYLQVNADGPLTLPFFFQRELDTHTAMSSTSVTRDVA